MTEEQLFADWARELSIQNRELKDDGEEPLTAAEFFQCRAEDALAARGRREQARVERWHATYNAALTGLLAFSHKDYVPLGTDKVHDGATKAADLAHGPLERQGGGS